MTKVVINRQFGGFNPSDELASLYQKKKGNSLYFYKQTKYRFSDGEDEFTRVDNESERGILTFATTLDFGKVTNGGELFNDHYFYANDLDRDDPLLVECVEELGVEKSSGAHCTLEIVEIPDDVKWHVEEYDGNEHIAEDHRTW